MDRIWLASPSPALRLRACVGAPHYQANPAALAWAGRAGSAPAVLDTLVQALRNELQPASAGSGEPDGALRGVLAGFGIEWSAVALDDGWLVWLHALGASAGPEAAEAAPSGPQQRVTTQLAHALRLARVVVSHVDLVTERVYFNDVGYEVNGFPADTDGVDLPVILARTHPDDREIMRRATEQALASERAVDIEVRFQMPGHPERHLAQRRVALRDANARVVGLLTVSIDQTPTARARSHSASLLRRLDVVGEAAGLGVWSVDLQTHAVEWNAQMLRLYGLPDNAPAPAYTAWLYDMVHPDDQAAVAAVWLRAAAGSDTAYEAQFRTVWPDGTLRWLVSRARRETLEGRDSLVGVLLDVTELTLQRQRAEQALGDKLTAERASRAKSQLLARVSHELRTPLNAVLGFAQLIEHDAAAANAAPALQLERVQHIRAAGEHLRSLIDDLLDLASIEAGTLVLHAEPVALAGALSDVAQWAAMQAREAGVAVHLQPCAGWVLADARRLRQLVSNLLSSAVKAGRAGGTVHVGACEVRGASAPGWQISVHHSVPQRVEVGAAQQPEPTRDAAAQADAGELTGLGLVTVHRLAELMGGQLAVLGEPGQGSGFRVWLPACEAPAANANANANANAMQRLPEVAAQPEPLSQAQQPAPPPAPEPAELSLVYIEDNAVNVILVQQLVAMRPAVVLACAPDGASGVAQALNLVPDLVLIDMHLPDMDGLEVLRRLRAAPSMAHTKMIALSANGVGDDIAEALAAGFDDYWTKPIDFRQFLAGLDALAEGSRSARPR
jgi:signal transduction histidine kinase/CheY-like chemotaxis protein